MDLTETLPLGKCCMTKMPDNIPHLPEYQVLDCKSTEDEMHFQVDAPAPFACAELH